MNICMYVKGKNILLLSYVIAIGYLCLRGMSTCLKLCFFVFILWLFIPAELTIQFIVDRKEP